MAEEYQPSKKRAAGRELSRDNPGLDDDEDVDENEMGTFKKASDEVLAARKIVKVRRQQTSTAASGPTSNPFAGIRLPLAPTPTANVPTEAQAVEDKKIVDDSITKYDATTEPEVKNVESVAQAVADKKTVDDPETKDDASTEPEVKNVESEEKPTSEQALEVNQLDQAVGDVAENVVVGNAEKTNGAKLTDTDEKQVVDDKTETSDKKENGKTEDSTNAPLNSFQQLSSTQNAFTGVAGTGFSTSAFSFGLIPKDGSPSQPSIPSFSFGTTNSGTTSLFGTTGTGSSIGGKTDGSGIAFSSMQDVPRETGEENEETVFSADSALFEFIDNGWKERGKGELKINVQKGETPKARLVMRAKGNLRLIMNASLYPDLKLTKMEKKGITFACINSANEGNDSLSTFALKFKDGSIVEEFSSFVSTHKGKPDTTLKTPENSPKAAED